MNPKSVVKAFLTILVLNSLAFSEGTGSNLRKVSPPIPPEEIIKKFAAKEQDFLEARENYTYRQTVKIEVLELDGRRTGEEFFEVSDVLFDNKGKRFERVIKAPPSTIRRLIMTAEDIHDIRNLYPFVLTTSSIHKYNLSYLGKEKIDEIDTYVFDVFPKKIEGDERYFGGRIWVDDQDLQIVKTYGKPVYQITKKNKDQLFPRFETYRQNIDGDYWFPVYSRADDVLNFPGNSVRVRETVKYENYKRFEADVKITVGDEVSDGSAKQD